VLIGAVLSFGLFLSLVAQMNQILEKLFPARAGLSFRVAEECARRAGEASPLGYHALRLALLRLRELGRYDDQAQVYHKKRANLNTEQNIFFIISSTSDITVLK
jgi:hypothetical protein